MSDLIRDATETDYKTVIRNICRVCGSKSCKHGYDYIRVARHYSPGKCFGRVYGGVGFYFGTIARNHLRLILFAVSSNAQRNGVGTALLDDLKQYAKHIGVGKITFRTSASEPAINWWEAKGGVVTGIKDCDYEVEITV